MNIFSHLRSIRDSKLRRQNVQKPSDTRSVNAVDDLVALDEETSVLRYLSEHEDSPISIREIARGSGISPYKTGIHIKHLIEDKIIVKSETRRGKPTRYWINRGPNSTV